MKTNVPINALIDVTHNELAGTGLQFAVVVWRPGFLKRGDPVAYGTRSTNDSEVADALMQAVDQITDTMKKTREG